MNKLLVVFFFYSLSLKGQICDPNRNSLLFDGHSSHVDFTTSNELNISHDITVEAWIFPTAWGSSYVSGSIVCKHGWTHGEEGYVLRAGGNGELSFNISGVKQNGQHDGWKEVVSPAGALQLNTWTHVAGTYDGSKLRLYINGSFSASETFHGTILPSVDYNLKIGKIADEGAANGRYWSGMIDEVRIWKRALSQTEISANMDHHINSQTANDLVGYWRLNDGHGSSINDLGSGNNTGTLSSATWNSNVPFSNGVLKPTITDAGGHLTSSSLYGNQWNLNGTPISGETGITFSPTTGGIYSLTVNYGLGCVATSDLLIITMSGINDLSDNPVISYYLSNNILNFISVPQELLKSRISLFDIDGKSLIQNEKFQDQINLGSLPAGIYVLLIQSDKTSFKSRIFIY